MDDFDNQYLHIFSPKSYQDVVLDQFFPDASIYPIDIIIAVIPHNYIRMKRYITISMIT